MGKSMFELPQDLIIKILMRLPMKSLLRFKCVSKQSLSFISCRDFCNSLFTITRQPQPQPRLYMSLLDFADCTCVYLSMSSRDNTRFVVEQDLKMSSSRTGSLHWNVFRSLICFSSKEQRACIYNPTTRQFLTLPAVKSDITVEQGEYKYTRYYIGHDPVSDQYKILCTIVISPNGWDNMKVEHWVFTVEARGSCPLLLGYPMNQAINGSVIHYRARLDRDTIAIVSFDVRSEEFTTFPLPEASVSSRLMHESLIEYGGKVAILDYSEHCADLWVLEEIAGKKEWLKQTLVLQSSQRHLAQYKHLIVKGTTRDGKVILAPRKMCSQFYILYYDMQNNDLRKVEIKGVPQPWFGKKCGFDLSIMDESEGFIYLET